MKHAHRLTNFRWRNRKANNLEMDLLPQHTLRRHRNNNSIPQLAERRAWETRMVQVSPVSPSIRLPRFIATHRSISSSNSWSPERWVCSLSLELISRDFRINTIWVLLGKSRGMDCVQGDAQQAERSSFTFSVSATEDPECECGFFVSYPFSTGLPDDNWSAYRITVLTGFPLFLAIVSIPERYQVVNSESSLGAGVRLIPLLCASAVGSTGNGLMCARKNLSFYSLLGANCFLLLGSGLLSSVPHGENIDPAIYGYQVIFGLGVGGTLSATTITAGINSNFEHYGE